MNIIGELFGKSPFGPLLQHTKKVYECVKLVKPLMEVMLDEEYKKVHELQDDVSKLEYEADMIKHEIRNNLPRRFFLPVNRDEFDNFLKCEDKIADAVEDLAVVLMIRETKFHPDLKEGFLKYVDQVVNVAEQLMNAAEEMVNLAETSFGGAAAESVLDQIKGLGEGEWRADRMEREVAKTIYSLESQLDPITIIFYEKILVTLGRIANEAENTGDLLRQMIVKG